MPQKQDYSNHVRYYPPHHFVFYPVMITAISFCTAQVFTGNPEHKLLWAAAAFGFVCLTWLAWMLRQHYALVLQNRIVVLELRYRYFASTGQRFEPLEQQLTSGQLYALRFAPDEELPELAQKAISQNLAPDAIKRSVKNWKADLRRV
jgi:Zn-dependent protease with chaperone function